MIDVFIRTTNANQKDRIRFGFFCSTMARWAADANANLIVLIDRGIHEGRMEAEYKAQSDPYIYTDDDVLPMGKDWIKRGLEAMLAHPEYAICSTLSLIEGENMAKGPEGAAIYPMHWVGAPMWIRKGILGADLPEMTLGSECGVIHDYVLAKGYKEGLIAGIRHCHLGHGFGSDPNQRWAY